VIFTKKQPGYKKRCGSAQNGQCEKVVKSKRASKKWQEMAMMV